MMKSKSYKDFPYTLYQIGNKYRDEVRPRLGLIRTREFTMKDAYSFDINQEESDKSYQKQFEAYHKICKEVGLDYVTVLENTQKLKPTNIKTAVYPGFPTDLQQPFTVLLTKINGKSKVTETIWENRFMHIPYLKALGADIEVKNQTATIQGPSELKGCEVVATDLRAGAAMVAAGLLASGKTTISSAEHILRGYEQIVEKLTSVGAKIEIKEI